MGVRSSVQKIVVLLIVLGALATPSSAQQASGPIVRCLEGCYFLVQCNATQLQVNEPVLIFRGGQQVARGKVVRAQGQLCSLLVEEGEAQRMDIVYAVRSAADQQGPELPQTYGSRATGVPGAAAAGRQSATAAAKSKRDEFFNGLQGGRVLDLGAGQISTEH